MIISDTSCMIGVLTISLLTAEFGQVWAKLGLRELRATLGEIAPLTSDLQMTHLARKCKPRVYKIVLDWKRDGRHEIAHNWYTFPC